MSQGSNVFSKGPAECGPEDNNRSDASTLQADITVGN